MPLRAWSGWARRIGIVLLFAAMASVVAVADLGATAASESDVWELAPVLLYGREVPDSPGSKVRETGRLYAVDAQTFAVWARVGGATDGWVLLGVREDRIETIGVERVSDEGATGGRPGVLVVKRQEIGLGSRLGWSVVAGQGQVYLQEKPLEDVPSGGTNPIHVWDRKGLRRLFGAGDEITHGGVSYRCAGATLGNANAGGTIVIAFTTSSPAKGFGLALHDAKGLRAIMTEDRPLPGTSAARLKESAMGCGAVRLEEAILADDGAVVLAGYLKDDGGTRKGIIAIAETATEMLVGAGDACPVEVGGKVRSCAFKVLDARAASRVVAAFGCRQPVASLWNGNRWTLVDAGPLEVDQAVLVAQDSSAVLWQGSADREERRGGEVKKLHAEGWGLFTGEISRDLRSQGNNPTGYDFVPNVAGFPGVILQYGWGVQGFPDRFIDALSLDKGAGALPSLQTSVGGVLLSDVLAWLGSDAALTVVRGPGFDGPRVSAGIYVMKRRQ